MSDFQHALSLSAGAMRAHATRLRHVSENIANADTPGYRRKIVSFHEATGVGEYGVRLGKTSLDQSDLNEVHDPAHPLADANGMYQSSNVDLMIEIADAREAQRSYEANLKMFDQARKMSSALMDLLRK